MVPEQQTVSLLDPQPAGKCPGCTERIQWVNGESSNLGLDSLQMNVP